MAPRPTSPPPARSAGSDANSVPGGIPSNPFSCTICHRRYSRIDHLARHHRSRESRSRPLSRPKLLTIVSSTQTPRSGLSHARNVTSDSLECKHSQISTQSHAVPNPAPSLMSRTDPFPQSDLLKRHAVTHSERPQSAKRVRTTGTPPPRRNRASKACVACAEAKGRCEGGNPCLRCQQKRIACEYAPSRLGDYGDSTRESSAPPPEDVSVDIDGDRIMDRVGRVSSPSNLDPSLIDYTQSIGAASDSININNIFAEDPITHVTHHAGPVLSPFGVTQVDQQGLCLRTHHQPTTDHYLDGIASSSAATHDGASAMFMADGSPNFAFDGLFDTSLDMPWPLDVLDFGMGTLAQSDNHAGDPFAMFNGDQDLSAALLVPRLGGVGGGTNAGDETPNPSGLVTPGGNGSFNINISARAFRESVWLWTPASINHAGEDQSNLALNPENITLDGHGCNDQPALQEQINSMTRGRMLAMVLKTCEPLIYPHVLSSFPKPDVLGIIIRNFLGFHTSQEMTWIHAATIEMNKESPEFLTALTASGATLSHIPEVRKLGYAMQEAVRIGLERKVRLMGNPPERYDADSCTTSLN
ncbi:hypothetical protein ANO11243_049830 [Dothideomycetidae sp. 11243]|nr:hypothetical protein ANO11243_049830 [fungal sp. No.11243]